MSTIIHGGRLDAAVTKYGGDREDWLDLSTGINPSAYPLPEISNESWQRLPDEVAQSELITAAKKYYQVPEEVKLVPANGTQAIIQNLPYLLKQKNIAIISPTYEEHRYSWKKAGRNVLKAKSLNDAVGMAEVVIVVNPNNPTAETYQRDELLEVARKLEQKSGFLIVDEAFGDCAPELSVVPQMCENIIVLRSFGKFFGLAGLRLGFAICVEAIADELLLRQGPWSVSGPALIIGADALANAQWVSNMRLQIRQNAKDQVEVIEACGLQLIGNAGLFMEFEHHNATGIHEALLQEHILVRQFADRSTRLRFGLCENMEQLERLAWVLKKNA